MFADLDVEALAANLADGLFAVTDLLVALAGVEVVAVVGEFVGGSIPTRLVVGGRSGHGHASASVSSSVMTNL